MDTPTRLRLQVDELTSEVNALRRRGDNLGGRPFDVRCATTWERSAEDKPYPRWSGDFWVPIRFWEEADGGRLYHTAEPAVDAFCPIKWLPPKVDVEVAQQPDGTWRLVRWPTAIRGVVQLMGELAQFDGYSYGCSQFAPQTGLMQVFLKDQVGKYSAQSYRDQTPVLMEIENLDTAAGDATGKMVLAVRDPDAWVMIEFCGDGCAGSYLV